MTRLCPHKTSFDRSWFSSAHQVPASSGRPHPLKQASSAHPQFQPCPFSCRRRGFSDWLLDQTFLRGSRTSLSFHEVWGSHDGWVWVWIWDMAGLTCDFSISPGVRFYSRSCEKRERKCVFQKLTLLELRILLWSLLLVSVISPQPRNLFSQEQTKISFSKNWEDGATHYSICCEHSVQILAKLCYSNDLQVKSNTRGSQSPLQIIEADISRTITLHGGKSQPYFRVASLETHEIRLHFHFREDTFDSKMVHDLIMKLTFSRARSLKPYYPE